MSSSGFAGVSIAMGADSGAGGNPGRWQGYFEHVQTARVESRPIEQDMSLLIGRLEAFDVLPDKSTRAAPGVILTAAGVPTDSMRPLRTTIVAGWSGARPVPSMMRAARAIVETRPRGEQHRGEGHRRE
jgi:hypothetical protein